jgi:hypothetical protein
MSAKLRRAEGVIVVGTTSYVSGMLLNQVSADNQGTCASLVYLHDSRVDIAVVDQTAKGNGIGLLGFARELCLERQSVRTASYLCRVQYLLLKQPKFLSLAIA